MRLTLRSVASLTLGFTGIIVLGAGLNRLLDIGSCASGGPLAVTRPCPEGTTLWSLLLPIGFVIAMAGLFLSEGGLVKPGTGQVIWTAGFTGGGVALLIKLLTTPSMSSDAKAGLYVVAALFIPMGLAFGIAGVVQLVRARRVDPRDPRPQRPRKQQPKPARDSDQQRLHRLRSTGALSRAEFDELRARPDGRLALIQQLSELKASGILTAAEFEAKKQAALRGD